MTRPPSAEVKVGCHGAFLGSSRLQDQERFCASTDYFDNLDADYSEEEILVKINCCAVSCIWHVIKRL
jgi:hypothetical protein